MHTALPATQYPVLDQLPVGLRHALESSAQAIRVPGGAAIFDEHQPCAGFPLLLEGRIRVVKAGPGGRELPLYHLVPGDSCVISTSCLLGRVDYNARAVAMEDCALLLIPRGVFEQLLSHVPFREFVFSVFAERLGDMMRLVEEIAFQRLDRRLAGTLLGHGRIVAATHQQLADELGSVREIVTRLLNGFAEQGLVALGRGRIEILDPAGLRRLGVPAD